MSDRHDKVAEIIRAVAATFVTQEANTNPLITITRATIAPNYRQTTIYFTTIPDDKEDDALIFLQRHAREVRGRIKRDTNLKYIPHVSFAIDRGERHRQHIDTLVDSTKKAEEQ